METHSTKTYYLYLIPANRNSNFEVIALEIEMTKGEEYLISQKRCEHSLGKSQPMIILSLIFIMLSTIQKQQAILNRHIYSL